MQRKSVLVLFLIIVACAATSNAFAQTGAEIASRHILLNRAMDARDQGDHARALDLAERAGRLRMTASVRYFIAEEQSALSLITDALASAEQCLLEVGREPASRNRHAVEANCRRLVDQLHQRVGYVVVLVSRSPANTVVQVNGHSLPSALLGAPFVVAAGRVSIDATADGCEPMHNEVLVPPTHTINVEITLSPRVMVTPVPMTHTPPVVAAAPPTAHQTMSATPQMPNPPIRIPPRTRIVRSPAGLVIGGIGLLGIAAGTIFGLYADSLYDDFRANCLSVQRCPDRQTMPDNVRLMDTAANASFIGGGALLATGAVLYLAVRRTETIPAVVPRVAYDASSRGITLGWNF